MRVDFSKNHIGYDAFGNRSRKTEYQTAGELVTTYRYNTKNQLMQETDADGTIQKAVYQYNGLGHRMGQNIATGDAAPARTIRYTLDLTRQYHNLLQKTGNGPDQTYFWDGNVAGMEEEGRDHFYFQDDLGSPMRLTDETGRSEEAYGFDEFGNDIRTAKDIFQDSMQSFGFTGYQMDSAGGLYFAQARRYDAGAGRFVSEDFLKGHIAVPYTMNHYNYCWNRPMDLVDLNGMWPSWSDIGNGIKKAASSVGEFVSEHKEAIIATAGAVIAVTAMAALTVVTGGLAGPVIAGAVVGAGINATGTVAEQVIEGGWNNIDIDKVTISAATGAISGAMMGMNIGVAAAIIGNGLISVSGSVASDMVDYDRGEDITSEVILENATKNGIVGSIAGCFGGAGAQYKSYMSTTVTSIMYDGNRVISSSGITEQCFYGSYKNMLDSNFKIGAVKTGMVTTGITVKNILENNAEEDCQKRKEGDK